MCALVTALAGGRSLSQLIKFLKAVICNIAVTELLCFAVFTAHQMQMQLFLTLLV